MSLSHCLPALCMSSVCDVHGGMDVDGCVDDLSASPRFVHYAGSRELSDGTLSLSLCVCVCVRPAMCSPLHYMPTHVHS